MYLHAKQAYSEGTSTLCKTGFCGSLSRKVVNASSLPNLPTNCNLTPASFNCSKYSSYRQLNERGGDAENLKGQWVGKSSLGTPKDAYKSKC